MDERRGKSVVRILLTDAAAFGLMGLIVYVVRAIKSTERGFFCHDKSIRYPDKPSTVPSWLVYRVGVLLSLLAIGLIEYQRETGNKNKCSPYRLQNYRIRSSHWSMYGVIVGYASGLLFTQATVLVGKVLIGRLRPNFIAVCRPDLENLCPDPNSHSYIEHFNCSHAHTSDSRASFPSGHSSFSFYVAVFLVLRVQKVLKTKSIVTKAFLQFLPIALAWYVSLSRVMDYKHHWSDVLVGMLIGSTVAILNTVFAHPTSGWDEERLTRRPDPLLGSRYNASSSNEKQSTPLLAK